MSVRVLWALKTSSISQAYAGIRVTTATGVTKCALRICRPSEWSHQCRHHSKGRSLLPRAAVIGGIVHAIDAHTWAIYSCEDSSARVDHHGKYSWIRESYVQRVPGQAVVSRSVKS